MVWVKLNCLKSSGEWIPKAVAGTTTEASFGNSIQWRTECETFFPNTRVNETDEVTNGHPNPS